MKKYLLGLIAVILAIGFSAFTSDSHPNQKTGTTYYWYPIVNNQIDGSKLNSTKVDKATAMSSLTTCEDISTSLCIAGSDQSNLGQGDAVPDSQGDNYVFHTN